MLHEVSEPPPEAHRRGHEACISQVRCSEFGTSCSSCLHSISGSTAACGCCAAQEQLTVAEEAPGASVGVCRT